MAGTWQDNLQRVFNWKYDEGKESIETRPWWMTEDAWKRRQNRDAANNWDPSVSRAEFLAKYQPQLDAMRQYAFGASGTWQGPSYQSIGPYSNPYSGSLETLLARMQGGATDADRATARQQALGAMGMTEDQYNQIAGSAYQTAEQMQGRADAMATTDSDAYRKFSAMVQAQQKSAVAGMGKQLETIFAERGGWGGFAAAQEMTQQISDQALQMQTQYLMDRAAQSLQLIQAENSRNANIVGATADMQRQFLNDNWARIGDAYASTMAAANQALQEYQTRADVNAQDYQMNLQAFLAPLNAMKDQMMTMLGVDEASFQYVQSMYDEIVAPYLMDLQEQIAMQG